MVVRNFNVIHIAAFPAKANAPLVVDADAVLTGPAATPSFQPIAGRSQQIAKRPGMMQVQQFAPGRALNIRRELTRRLAVKDLAGFVGGEAHYHEAIISRHDSNVKIVACPGCRSCFLCISR